MTAPSTAPARDGRRATSRRSPARRRSRRPPGPRSPTRSCATNLGRATATIRTKRAQRRRRARRLGGAAARRRRHQGRRPARPAGAARRSSRRAVTAAGGVVHWARDAAEANAIVAGIARDARRDRGRQGQVDGDPGDRAQRGARAQDGHRRLGDRPGRDDRPARPRPALHILVPAIHRNRTEIRDIFRDEMGAPAGRRRTGLTDDPARAGRGRPPAPAREVPARRGRRSRAPTSRWPRPGTIVVLESEGNGRMCLTLPEVLITVMGIEKLVPTWRDLEVFLQLLPRSSTAERMNPYTSIWTGVTPGDGPQAFHLVLLDNGRTDVLVRHRRPAGAALHPLLGLPERLPGLRADRRSGLRLGLSRPDRRDPHAAAAGHRQAPGRRADRLAAVRLVAVRRLLRGLPGRDRYPGGARPPARPGRRQLRGDAPAADRGGRRHARPAWMFGSRPARAGRAGSRSRRSAARSAREAAAGCPDPGRSRLVPGARPQDRRRANRSVPGGGGPAAGRRP